MSDQQAQTQRDPRSKLRRKWNGAWAETKWQTYLLYCRTLYRPHMRLIHSWGWHWFSVSPIDRNRVCQWCGKRLPPH
jgi:hypothetical protein